ncbi:MAG: DEAD/DEAH box helicase [Deltaproteobacteria bacterium]|jgi:non-specific serine/threonine protein kinase|nr:DEAD/DEAH box helicase [Deltaproteobacteria bacterium]
MRIDDTIESVRLTPQGSLAFQGLEGDWREILFSLGAQRVRSIVPAVRFWRSFSELFVSALCHLKERLDPTDLSPPSPSRLERLAFGAPPMQGGEYLSAESLTTVWNHLIGWSQPLAHGRVAEFLSEKAPAWKRVGRVIFQLADHPSTPELPFAFIVTYIVTLNAEGDEKHIPLKLALEQYSGESNRAALLSLLTPVKAAAEKLKWVADLVGSKDIYSSLLFSIQEAHRFLVDQPVLTECGLIVKIPDWWHKAPKVMVAVTVGKEKGTHLGAKTLFDWDVGLSIEGQDLTAEEAQELEEILSGAGGGLIRFKGRWLEADQEKIKEALAHWRKAKEESEGSGLTFIKAMRLLAGLPGAAGEKGRLPSPSPWVVPMAGTALGGMLEKIRDPKAAKQPRDLGAELRPYQRKGLDWLRHITGMGLGACLADDMGLGKTMQVLALLLLEKDKGTAKGPSLLVTPASLMANWKSEAASFAPSLKLKIFHSSETSKDDLRGWQDNPDRLLKGCDLVVTSYGMLSKNSDFFEKIHWPLVIIDEAQAIKNPGTFQTRAVKKMRADSRIAMTGTPIENRLTDMWSIFDFLNPGLLGSLRRFQGVVSDLEAGGGDHYAPLRRLVSPYILRRLKTDRRIISELPDKTETSLYCNLTAQQAKLYATVVSNMSEALESVPDSPSDMNRRGLVLKSIVMLKQVINHPAQYTGDGDWDYRKSGKFQRLKELCQEFSERQERVLVFTQYREIIPPLFDHLSSVFGEEGLVLHGGTPVSRRQKLVRAFQGDNGPPFFILSLKAGGTGLNLTAAGQVIHFDRWWNPAVEDQATDRAYRIGQRKNVLVHKCVTSGTIEERVNAMLHDKRALASDILSVDKGKEIDICKLDNKSLIRLVSLDIDRAVSKEF